MTTNLANMTAESTTSSLEQAIAALITAHEAATGSRIGHIDIQRIDATSTAWPSEFLDVRVELGPPRPRTVEIAYSLDGGDWRPLGTISGGPDGPDLRSHT